jgi:hypothetical protein
VNFDLKKIELNNTNNNDFLSEDKKYIIKHDGEMFFGSFTKQWFGWVFRRPLDKLYMQLNFIQEVYECDDLEFRDNKTRDISITRNINKVIKDPSLLSMSFNSSGSLSVKQMIDRWSHSDFKYILNLSDIERYVKKSQMNKYILDISECYIKKNLNEK